MSAVGRQPSVRNGVDMAEVEKKLRVAIVGGGLVREFFHRKNKFPILYFDTSLQAGERKKV